MQSLPTTIAKSNEINLRLQDTEIISTITSKTSHNDTLLFFKADVSGIQADQHHLLSLDWPFFISNLLR